MKQKSLLRFGAFLMAGLMASSAFADGASAPATETLPSGVVIEHVSPGLGAQPGPASMVEVEYIGQLKDGTVFDKHTGGKPISFPVNGVISCWSQSLQRMRAGGTAIVKCPAATAYGEHGAGGVIPPNADLTFKVHLVAVKQ
jgi:FKBP-type peptidyl-prolyl cis-trans isomerase FkpA